jgi:ribose transport system substrate-binding protein
MVTSPRRRRTRIGALGVTLLASAVLALAGCGTGAPSENGGGAGSAGAAGSTVAVPRPPGPPKIGLFLPVSEIVTYTHAEAEGARAAAKKLGITIDVITNEKYDAATQYNQIQNAISQKTYNAIIIHPGGPNLCKLLDAAVKQDVVVVPIVAPLCADPAAKGSALYTPGTLTYVGGQGNYDGNAAFLKQVTDHLPGTHTAVSVNGPQGSLNAQAWDVAITDELKGKDLAVEGTVYTDYSIPDSLSKVTAYLQGHRDVDTVLAADVNTAQGAVKAVQGLGLQDSVKVYMPGADEIAKTLIRNNQVAGATPFFPTSVVTAAVQAIVDHSDGKDVPTYIGEDGVPDLVAKTPWLDASNIDSFTPQF